MFCQNCGKELFGATAVCPYCGAPVNKTADTNFNQNLHNSTDSTGTAHNSYILNGVPQNGYSQNNYQNQYHQQSPFNPAQNQNTIYNGYGAVKEIESAKTMGIVSVVFAVLGFSVIGLILGIIGYGKAKRVYFANSFDTNARSAYNWNKAGIITNVIRLVITLIALIAYITVFATMVSEGNVPEIEYSMFVH